MWGEARGRVEPAKKSHRVRTGCPSTLSHVKCFMPHPLFRVRPRPSVFVVIPSSDSFFRSHARFRYFARCLIAALPRSRTAGCEEDRYGLVSPYHEQHFSDSTMPLSFFLPSFLPFFQMDMHRTRAQTFATRAHALSLSLSLAVSHHLTRPFFLSISFTWTRSRVYSATIQRYANVQIHVYTQAHIQAHDHSSKRGTVRRVIEQFVRILKKKKKKKKVRNHPLPFIYLYI